MAIADLLKRRANHTCHTTTPTGVTATSPVVTGGHTNHTCHTTKNRETEHEPPNPLAKSAQSAQSAAPAHEIERIIAALVNEVSRDLGPELVALMRRAMRPMDRATRANLTAEIDDAFEASASVKEAREQASLAIRSRAGNHQPSNTDEWLVWIAERCPLLPEDRAHVASRLFRLHTRWQGRLAEQYVEAWHTAADDEPTMSRR